MLGEEPLSAFWPGRDSREVRHESVEAAGKEGMEEEGKDGMEKDS